MCSLKELVYNKFIKANNFYLLLNFLFLNITNTMKLELMINERELV